MGLFSKLTTWWSKRQEEQRAVEQARAAVRRAGDEKPRPASEVFDEHDLRGG
ncbi:MAG TPA: hypothetical protein VF002_10405 [Gaiellaceae bacterium]